MQSEEEAGAEVIEEEEQSVNGDDISTKITEDENVNNEDAEPKEQKIIKEKQITTEKSKAETMITKGVDINLIDPGGNERDAATDVDDNTKLKKSAGVGNNQMSKNQLMVETGITIPLELTQLQNKKTTVEQDVIFKHKNSNIVTSLGAKEVAYRTEQAFRDLDEESTA